MQAAVRILVADDDPRIREATCEILTAAGYEAVAVTDGAELVSAHRRDPADVILCDLFMPQQDGLETIRQLRRESPLVRIIAMSGGGYSGSLDVMDMARLMGAMELLRKPFNKTMLLESVERALSR
jgi:DNA-binding NtrC family response regulator